MKKINAEIVADSIDPRGNRITSFLLTYPRFIHGELMTHRMFSRNSASSRAIPFKKMVKMVEEDPFIPIAWQKDHKKMQGSEYITDKIAIKNLKNQWLKGRDAAIEVAKSLNRGAYTLEVAKDENGNNMRGFTYVDIPDTSVTKQLCNRLLEPFMWHTVLVTATEFDNFFKLRCPKYQTPVSKTIETQYSWKDLIENHSNPINLDILEENQDNWIFKMQYSLSGAEIHIQALAESMWDAMNESVPVELQEGEWHIPFSDKIDTNILSEMETDCKLNTHNDPEDVVIGIATARCARLSYMTFDGEIDYEKDIKLHDSLLKSRHMSPFEHVARCMSDLEYYSFIKGKYPTTKDEWGIVNYECYPFKSKEMFAGKDYEFIGENSKNPNIYGWCNNFKGFIPYRYLIENC